MLVTTFASLAARALRRSARTPVPTLVSQGAGTAIGNMTGDGGLAASFNGNNSQANGAASTGGGATSPYIGKTWSAPKIMSQVQVWGASDQGYINSSATVTLTFYGKQGAAPSSGTNGTPLGTSVFSDTASSNTKTITSSDTTTAWDHNWVTISPDGVNSWFAEMEFTELA